MASAMIGSRPVEELASQILRQGRGLWIKARGGSMTPFLRDGDVAFVTPAGDGGIRVGDVICYESTCGRLFLHRVITCQAGRVVTRGDALTSAAVIPARQILGIVSALARGGRVRRLDTRAARWGSRVVVSLSPALSRLVHLAVESRDLTRAMIRG